MPVAATFRRISSGLGSGTGTSSIRSGSLYPYILAARIFMSSPPSRVTRSGLVAQSSNVHSPSVAQEHRPHKGPLTERPFSALPRHGPGGWSPALQMAPSRHYSRHVISPRVIGHSKLTHACPSSGCGSCRCSGWVAESEGEFHDLPPCWRPAWPMLGEYTSIAKRKLRTKTKGRRLPSFARTSGRSRRRRPWTGRPLDAKAIGLVRQVSPQEHAGVFARANGQELPLI